MKTLRIYRSDAVRVWWLAALTFALLGLWMRMSDHPPALFAVAAGAAVLTDCAAVYALWRGKHDAEE